MNGRGRQGRPPAGFTLVELTIVILLLGILSAMILPEMRGTYGEAVLRAGSRDLVDVCAIAASRAVSFRQAHRVRLDPATGRFRVEKRGRAADGEAAFVPVREVPGCQGELDPRIVARIHTGQEASEPGREEEPTDREGAPTGATLDLPPAATLSFYPDGTADRGEIVLRHQDGYGLALRLNPVTARVRVLELKRR